MFAITDGNRLQPEEKELQLQADDAPNKPAMLAAAARRASLTCARFSRIQSRFIFL
jgi:hypothetical protein